MVVESEDIIAEMAKYNNTTAIAKEQRAIDIISSYLPPRATPSEITSEIQQVIAKLNASSLKVRYLHFWYRKQQGYLTVL